MSRKNHKKMGLELFEMTGRTKVEYYGGPVWHQLHCPLCEKRVAKGAWITDIWVRPTLLSAAYGHILSHSFREIRDAWVAAVMAGGIYNLCISDYDGDYRINWAHSSMYLLPGIKGLDDPLE